MKQDEFQGEHDSDARHDARLHAAWSAALAREDAPEGFAERLEARIAAGAQKLTKPRHERARILQFGPMLLRRESRLAIAAALMLALLLPVGWEVHHRAEAARGEAAKEQVMLALRITGTHLRAIQQHTHTINAGIPEGDSQ